MDEQNLQRHEGEEHYYGDNRGKITPPPSRKPLLIMSVALAVMVLIVVGLLAEVIHLATPQSHASVTSQVVPLNTLTAQPTQQVVVPPTMPPTPTDTAQPTDTSSPVPTLPPTPGPATKAATLPFVMNCECASNPVQVRVTAVHIQQSLGTMTWDLTLLNVGTRPLEVTFRQIGLDLNGRLSLAEGGMVDNAVPLAPNGQSGDTAQSTITFTFVPQQGTYMLKAIMDLCPGICDSVFYNGTTGIPFTFQ